MLHDDPYEYLNECREALAKAPDLETQIGAEWWLMDAQFRAPDPERP